MFEQKETPTIVKNQSNPTDYDNSKVVSYDLLRAELIYFTQDENKATDTLCRAMAVELAEAILVELRDTTKAIHEYLSSAEGKLGGRFSWGKQQMNSPRLVLERWQHMILGRLSLQN